MLSQPTAVREGMPRLSSQIIQRPNIEMVTGLTQREDDELNLIRYRRTAPHGSGIEEPKHMGDDPKTPHEASQPFQDPNPMAPQQEMNHEVLTYPPRPHQRRSTILSRRSLRRSLRSAPRR